MRRGSSLFCLIGLTVCCLALSGPADGQTARSHVRSVTSDSIFPTPSDGVVSVRDYGAIGNVTIMASRLSSEAKGGQILTNQKTARKVEHVVGAESVGDLQLKGFARPVAGFQLTGLKD